MSVLPLIVIPLMAVLNRLRGGGWWAVHLPGHPRWYVIAAVLGLAIWRLDDYIAAAMFAAAYGVWSLLPWGHLYSFGRWMPPRPASHLERALLELTRYHYWAAMVLLHGIGAAFLAPLIWWEWPGPELSATVLLPVLITAVHEIAWSADEAHAIPRADLATGALWGVYLTLVSL
jgi:hypothetical protein